MRPSKNPISKRWRLFRRSVAAGAAALLAVSVSVFGHSGVAHADSIGGWELDAMNVSEAWETTRGEGVTLAVVDTGVAEHPYFDDKDVLPGHSFVEEEPDGRYDRHGHGTSVASNAMSVAPDATLMPVKYSIGKVDLFGEEDQLPTRLADKDIVWAVDNGADILALPWGEAGENPREMNAIQYALDNDVIVIAGAGNDPDEYVWWPAAFDGVIAVSGTDENNDLYVDSTTGDEVTLAAPATDITSAGLSSSFDEDYVEEQVWGTSTATGLVAGVAALVLASDSDVDANNAIARMTDSAQDLGASGWDSEFGHGLIDAAAAVDSTINDHEENPLGYPFGEANAEVDIERFGDDDEPEEPEEDSDVSDSDSGSTEDSASSGEETLAGLPPYLFWTLTGAVIVAILTTMAALLYRNKKQQQPPHWQQPSGPPPSGLPPAGY